MGAMDLDLMFEVASGSPLKAPLNLVNSTNSVARGLLERPNRDPSPSALLLCGCASAGAEKAPMMPNIAAAASSLRRL